MEPRAVRNSSDKPQLLLGDEGLVLGNHGKRVEDLRGRLHLLGPLLRHECDERVAGDQTRVLWVTEANDVVKLGLAHTVRHDRQVEPWAQPSKRPS